MQKLQELINRKLIDEDNPVICLINAIKNMSKKVETITKDLTKNVLKKFNCFNYD